jgi:AraC-like DNA-binding protein
MSGTIIPSIARLSTDDFPELQTSALSEQIANALPKVTAEQAIKNTLLRVNVETARETPFRSSISSRLLGDLQVFKSAMSAARLTWQPENDHIVLLTSYAGDINLHSKRREITLQQGEATLFNCAEAVAHQRLATGTSLTIGLPRSLISGLAPNIEDVALKRIPRNSGARSLLTSYLDLLLMNETADGYDLQDLPRRHIVDLIAATLEPGMMTSEANLDSGVNVARLQAARTYITQNANQNISIGSVAHHLGISPRYLQLLFESTDTTFTSFLLELRLLKAHRMLTNTRYNANSIELIAYQTGFGDTSYFSRAFRRRFGAPPRDIRRRVELDSLERFRGHPFA